MPLFEIETPDGTFEVEAPSEMAAIAALGGVDQPNVGVAAGAKAMQPQQMGVAEDMARSGASGLRSGAESMAGMWGEAADTQGSAASWLASKLGVGPEGQAIAGKVGTTLHPGALMLPTNAIRGVTETVFGEGHKPQTVAGEYARTVGQYAPAAALSPGSLLRKGAMAVVPGAMSETAGQITKDTALEPYARAAGGIFGGALAAGRNVSAPKTRAPTAEEIKAGGRAAYNAADMTSVAVAPGAVKRIAGNVQLKLKSFAHDAQLQPETAVVVKRLAQATRQKGLRLADLENVRKMASDVARGAQRPSDREAARIIVDQIDNAMDDAATLVGGQGNVAALKTAREAWKRARKTEIIETAIDKAKNQATGFENGLVVQFRSMANNPRVMRQFTKQEQQLIRSVVRRPSAHGMMRAIGMLSPNSTFGGMTSVGLGVGSGILPGLAAAGIGYGARKGAEALTRGKVGALQSAVATGRIPPTPQMDPNALVRFLLASKAAENSALVNTSPPAGIPIPRETPAAR